MTVPVVSILYVGDAPAAARFYGELLGKEPEFESPRYITFSLAEGVSLAVWSGHDTEPDAKLPRTGEFCLLLEGGPEAIEDTCRDWRERGVEILRPPYDEVFGRTFVAADPDGNLIRVAPQD